MNANNTKVVWALFLSGALIVGCKRSDDPVVPPAPTPPVPTAPTPAPATPSASSGSTFDEIIADARALKVSSQLKDQIKAQDWTAAQASLNELNELRPKLSTASQSSIDQLQKLLKAAQSSAAAPAQ